VTRGPLHESSTLVDGLTVLDVCRSCRSWPTTEFAGRCVGCAELDGRDQPAVCACCGYWTPTVGVLCEACALDEEPVRS
jgi:hypothetical protein